MAAAVNNGGRVGKVSFQRARGLLRNLPHFLFFLERRNMNIQYFCGNLF